MRIYIRPDLRKTIRESLFEAPAQIAFDHFGIRSPILKCYGKNHLQSLRVVSILQGRSSYLTDRNRLDESHHFFPFVGRNLHRDFAHIAATFHSGLRSVWQHCGLEIINATVNHRFCSTSPRVIARLLLGNAS